MWGWKSSKAVLKVVVGTLCCSWVCINSWYFFSLNNLVWLLMTTYGEDVDLGLAQILCLLWMSQSLNMSWLLFASLKKPFSLLFVSRKFAWRESKNPKNLLRAVSTLSSFYASTCLYKDFPSYNMPSILHQISLLSQIESPTMPFDLPLDQPCEKFGYSWPWSSWAVHYAVEQPWSLLR